MFTDGGRHIVQENFLRLSPGNESGEAKFSVHKRFPVNVLNVDFCWQGEVNFACFFVAVMIFQFFRSDCDVFIFSDCYNEVLNLLERGLGGPWTFDDDAYGIGRVDPGCCEVVFFEAASCLQDHLGSCG